MSVASTAKKIIDEALAIPDVEYKDGKKTLKRPALVQINTSDNYMYSFKRYDLKNMTWEGEGQEFLCIKEIANGVKHYVNSEMINTIIVNPDPVNVPLNGTFYNH